MKTITTLKNQTIFDIAVQYYGNLEAFEEILRNNPDIENDYSCIQNAGIPYFIDEFDLAFPLKPDQKLLIDENSVNYKKNIVKELNTIISFDKIE